MCRIYLRGCLVPSKNCCDTAALFNDFFICQPISGRYSAIKKLEKYYDPVRDGTECVIPLGTCFCMATVLVFLEKMDLLERRHE